jgi:hypothetical protein
MFTGITNAFGQTQIEVPYLDAVPTFCPTPTALSCLTGTGNTPMPGVSYPYTISSNITPSAVHWFVTDDPAVIAGQTKTVTIDPGDGTGDYLLTSDVVGDYNNPSGTDLTIELTWNSFDGNAHEVLLVVYTLDDTGCTDNVQAWRIIPQYNFTLDVAGILDDGTEGASECVSPVQTATYNGTELEMDYGQNYVFFAVNAANWSTSWVPSIGDGTTTTYGATIVGYEWAYPDEASGAGAVWNVSNTAVLASHYASAVSGFIGAAGECIIVKVELDHDNYELDGTDEIVSLAVDGDMWNPVTTAHDGTYPDLDDNDSACNGDSTDEAEYTIESRPTIDAVDPIPFVTKI